MKAARKTRRTFDPQQKITAVLSIWTERRTTSEVCREMDVSYSLLDRWQNQAMEGMLTALEPKKKQRDVALNARLTKLIEKNITSRSGKLAKLEERLETIQRGRRPTA